MTIVGICSAVVVGGLVILLIVLALTVDDWSRDLTTNHAVTSPTAEDPLLRPLSDSRSPEELADLVTTIATDLPKWELAERRVENATIVLALTRTTPLFQFQDDITVRIVSEESGDGAVLSAESQSRAGRGDLGQNPRNLREFLGAVRERLGE